MKKYLLKPICCVVAFVFLASNPVIVFGQDMAIPIQATEIKPECNLDEVMVDIDYKGVDLNTVLRTLAYTYGLNLVSTKSISGSVTVTLSGVSLAEALEAILSTNGYTYVKKGKILYILEGPGVENLGITTELINLHYLMAEDAIEFLDKVISGKGDIKISEATNSIVISDFPEVIKNAKKVISDVDTPPIQVVIEAKLLDINTQDLQNLGVTYTFDYSPTGNNKGLFNRNVAMQETLAGSYAMTSTTDLTENQIQISDFSIKGFSGSVNLSALFEDKDTEVLASPSIATLNGKEAKIVIGERYPYKEKTQTTTGTTESTKFVDIGTILSVTPYVSPGGHITMEVHPEVSTFFAALDDGSPRITTREANATVRVKDGQTIMLAGLIKQDNSKTVDKIPILGSLPIVGYLFSSRSKDYDQRELVIFLTPHIVPFEGDSKEIEFGEQKETFINIEGMGERALISKMMTTARKLESNQYLVDKFKDETIRLSNAVDSYRQVSSQFPDSKQAPEAIIRAARIYFNKLKEYNNAANLARQILEKYPNSVYVGEAKSILQVSEKKLSKIKRKIKKVDEWTEDYEKRSDDMDETHQNWSDKRDSKRDVKEQAAIEKEVYRTTTMV